MNIEHALHWGVAASLRQPPVFHVTGTSDDAEAFVDSAPQWVVAKILRAGDSRSKINLMHQWAAAFQLPGYCRDNWNSFSDCVSDIPQNRALSWLPVGLVVVAVITESELLLDQEPYQELFTFIDIIEKRSAESASVRVDAEFGEFDWPHRLATVLQTTAETREKLATRLPDIEYAKLSWRFDN